MQYGLLLNVVTLTCSLKNSLILSTSYPITFHHLSFVLNCNANCNWLIQREGRDLRDPTSRVSIAHARLTYPHPGGRWWGQRGGGGGTFFNQTTSLPE